MYLVGHDGHTAFERLMGKPSRDDATRSASAFSTACDRRTWTAASTPGGGPESGWGAVGARRLTSSQ
eukprot:600771-Alexandrium_andersonii.AAC.1